MTDPALVLQADVALDLPGRGIYTYRVTPELAGSLAVGDCVEVPLKGQKRRGFVVAIELRPEPVQFPLKDVPPRQDGISVPAHLMALMHWGARYYRCGLGAFLAGTVPKPVRETALTGEIEVVQLVAERPEKLSKRQQAILSHVPAEGIELGELCDLAKTQQSTVRKLAQLKAVRLETVAVELRRDIREVGMEARGEHHAPTDEQRAAIDAVAAELAASKHAAFLLYGVTGSGKTLVYLELAERVIAQGRQVLYLLPEIGLTPQLAARVRSRIPRTVVWHSAFSAGERAEAWRRVAAGEVDVVLGTRSALFAPLPKPGLIIVDEEHDQSYKQESVPRYHARDLAVVYGGQLSVPVILGSATPALESVANVRAGRYRVLRLANRPGGGKLPAPVLVDMRLECKAQKKAAVLSRELVDRLAAAKAAGNQGIILLNRRGWSPIVACAMCGAAVECKSCAIAMTWHRGAAALRCHYCDATSGFPERCPACNEPAMSTRGVGTEQLAALVAEAVPGLRILRVDADTVSTRQGHAKLFTAFSRGEADCLVGTQMVAKGLDFPRVTVVGVIGADRSLAQPDFRSAERTYQLIAQVAGRAGRGEHPGAVVVQAYDINALALRAAVEHRPKTFYDEALAQRQEYGYPPYAGLVRVMWSGPELVQVEQTATTQGTLIHTVAAPNCQVLGPNPAGLAFLHDQHRWHALIKAPTRGDAQRFLDRLEAAGGLPATAAVRVTVDVDPYHTT